MTEHCIIKADFASFRPVQGRKVLQLVLEVAIEDGDDALKKLGGMPRPGESRWCAIALLNNPQSGPSKTKLSESPDSGGGPILQAEGGSPKKSWSEIPRSQQAAILCSDADFQRYFVTRDAEDCAHKLRQHFHIPTRRELDKPERHAGWDEFVALYHMHRDRLK